MPTTREPGPDAVVLGAGILGLQIARLLVRRGRRVTLVEREAACGGMCRSVQIGDHVADLGPHFFFCGDTFREETLDEYQSALGSEGLVSLGSLVDRSLIFSRNAFTKYPLSVSNVLRCHGLPFLAGSLIDKLVVRSSGPTRNARDLLQKSFGAPIFRAFFSAYLEKSMGLPATEIDVEWGHERADFLGRSGLIGFLRYMARLRRQKDYGHFYPRTGGAGALVGALAADLALSGGEILTGSEVHGVTTRDGRVVSIDVLIGGREIRTLPVGSGDVYSTIPLPELVARIGSTPDDVRLDAEALGFRALNLLYLRLSRPRLGDAPQVYVGDPTIPFKRYYETNVVSRQNSPEGETVVCLEFCCEVGDDTWRAEPAALLEPALAGLARMGHGLTAADVLEARCHRLPNAYPRYQVGFKPKRERVLDFLRSHTNLHPCGRQGEFHYNLVTHLSMRRARQVVESG